MSFCDPSKKEGEKFLGVIIAKAYGLISAVDAINRKGLNPGGEIESYVIDPDEISYYMMGVIKDNLYRLIDCDELNSLGFRDE